MNQIKLLILIFITIGNIQTLPAQVGPDERDKRGLYEDASEALVNDPFATNDELYPISSETFGLSGDIFGAYRFNNSYNNPNSGYSNGETPVGDALLLVLVLALGYVVYLFIKRKRFARSKSVLRYPAIVRKL